MPDYFEHLKNYLDITFEDAALDQKLSGICTRAEYYLRNRIGREILFSADMPEQDILQLLFDCVRYIWSNALDEFAENYREELDSYRRMSHVMSMEDDDEE